MTFSHEKSGHWRGWVAAFSLLFAWGVVNTPHSAHGAPPPGPGDEGFEFEGEFSIPLDEVTEDRPLFTRDASAPAQFERAGLSFATVDGRRPVIIAWQTRVLTEDAQRALLTGRVSERAGNGLPDFERFTELRGAQTTMFLVGQRAFPVSILPVGSLTFGDDFPAFVADHPEWNAVLDRLPARPVFGTAQIEIGRKTQRVYLVGFEIGAADLVAMQWTEHRGRTVVRDVAVTEDFLGLLEICRDLFRRQIGNKQLSWRNFLSSVSSGFGQAHARTSAANSRSSEVYKAIVGLNPEFLGDVDLQGWRRSFADSSPERSARVRSELKALQQRIAANFDERIATLDIDRTFQNGVARGTAELNSAQKLNVSPEGRRARDYLGSGLRQRTDGELAELLRITWSGRAGVIDPHLGVIDPHLIEALNYETQLREMRQTRWVEAATPEIGPHLLEKQPGLHVKAVLNTLFREVSAELEIRQVQIERVTEVLETDPALREIILRRMASALEHQSLNSAQAERSALVLGEAEALFPKVVRILSRFK